MRRMLTRVRLALLPGLHRQDQACETVPFPLMPDRIANNARKTIYRNLSLSMLRLIGALPAYCAACRR